MKKQFYRRIHMPRHHDDPEFVPVDMDRIIQEMGYEEAKKLVEKLNRFERRSLLLYIEELANEKV